MLTFNAKTFNHGNRMQNSSTHVWVFGIRYWWWAEYWKELMIHGFGFLQEINHSEILNYSNVFVFPKSLCNNWKHVLHDFTSYSIFLLACLVPNEFRECWSISTHCGKIACTLYFGWRIAVKYRETNWRLWMSSAIQDKCPPSGLVEENVYFYW
jgi:hypothetical protein